MLSKKAMLVVALVLFCVLGLAYAEEAEKQEDKKLSIKELMLKYSQYLGVTKQKTSQMMQQIQIRIEGGQRFTSILGQSENLAVRVSDDIVMYSIKESSSRSMVFINGMEGEDEEEGGLEVNAPDGKKANAEVLGQLKKYGVAFARVELEDPNGFKKLDFAPTNIEVGQKVLIFGKRESEWKFAPFYLKAEINGELPLSDDVTAFSLDAPEGQLRNIAVGAIVTDYLGNFLGIVHQFSGKSFAIGVVRPDYFAEAIKTAIESPDDLEDMQRHGNIQRVPGIPQIPDDIEEEAKPRAYLGISVTPIDQELADKLGLEKASGLLVKTVGADSPAAKAGLKEGDVILEAGGVEMNVLDDLKSLLEKNEPGAEIELVLFRDGKQFALKVTLGKQ